MQPAFSLVTFNCFGGLSWSPRRRLLTLARELERAGPTAVCLQEVQTHGARRLLIDACQSYTAHAYAPGLQAPRGALLTLSRAPLSQGTFLSYETQGAWHGPTLMDRLTRKGALVAQLYWGELSVVIINTHLLANYGADWRRASRAAQDQQRQLLDLAALVRQQPAARLVVLAGDFNLPRGSWLYEEFVASSGMLDSLAADMRPTYRPFPGVPASYALPIDFVFVRMPEGTALAVTADLCFGEPLALVGGGYDYLSDHLGVRLTISRIVDS
ncbi:MAG: endonuclease/exonuclease/phosphatase family protein [Deltaproteobacteria bacterium]|nr:endonuclease/exonuclease/phosphatase family protein [Deltaproteobacteria bacterium]